jgi:uncharacterized protein YndB with AHSA1/START domain
MDEIRKRITLNAPVQRVWAFLTDSQKLSTWLMDNDFTANEGARFTFSSPPSGRWDGTIHCEVQEIIEGQLIAYTWCANDIGVTTLVTFNITASGNQTHLTLTHSGFHEAAGGAAGRHAAGWHRCLKAIDDAVVGKRSGYDWSEFQISCFLDASIHEIFRFWSTARGLRAFWVDAISALGTNSQIKDENAEFDNGDRLAVTFSTGTRTNLEILNIERDKFLLFSFGEDYGWVQVSLSTEDTRTRVTLRQFGLPDGTNQRWEVHANARGWWIANLMNLKSVLAHGKDLRVREAEYSGSLNAIFQPDNESTGSLHDWTAFDVYLFIAANPADVLGYWQTTEGLRQFFIAEMTALDDQGGAIHDTNLSAGNYYRWRWIHDYEGEGQILESNAQSVEFTFGKSYRVRVSVAKAGSGTLLHLQQTGMSDDASEQVQGSLNCRSCWIYFLVNLKSILENGMDLRDHNPATADSVSVGFQMQSSGADSVVRHPVMQKAK